MGAAAGLRTCSTTAVGTKPIVVETYPRLVPEHLRPLIKPSDLLQDFSDFKVYRARADHIVFLIKPLEDFLKNETTCIRAGSQAHDKITWPFLYNCTRYPYSLFALNNNHEVVNITFQEIIYKDPSKDPRPRMDHHLSDPRDPFYLVGTVLGWVEHRLFEITGADRLLNNELVFTPSAVRRQKISGKIYRLQKKMSIEEGLKDGLKWTFGVATGETNARNVAKLGCTFPEKEQVSKGLYKNFEGKLWEPYNQP